VIQPANYHEVEAIADLAADLGVDFLNLRVDCIQLTASLNSEQEARLDDSLRRIRRRLDAGDYGGTEVDFADSLIERMDGWRGQTAIVQPEECRVHLYRSAINPFGRVAVCDLTAEPYFSTEEFTLGYVDRRHDYRSVLEQAAPRTFRASGCRVCMPGQISINALWEKAIVDYRDGIGLEEQPYFFVGGRREQKKQLD
jgi:MoaA/NifB/PqqE/SkfB family radical SAM enzyme